MQFPFNIEKCNTSNHKCTLSSHYKPRALCLAKHYMDLWNINDDDDDDDDYKYFVEQLHNTAATQVCVSPLQCNYVSFLSTQF
jgi:hypothetical protein